MALEQKNFKSTLNLPTTDFPIRPQHKTDDSALLARWQAEDLYNKTFHAHADAQKYVLHAGPPYANGHLHLGHAYSWILKDIMAKAYRMAGYHTPFKPGWDCHGLPIEIKVQQEHKNLSSLELKKACRTYAAGWINVQREEFKKMGILADWQNPYITMDPTYEADTVRAFGILFEKGFIERKHKTVAWCPSCATTLASAEIEYKERKDPSIYVQFELDERDAKKLFPHIADPIFILVWTTTPWTLPLNRAVMLKEGADYQVLDILGKKIIVGAARADVIAHLLGVEKKVLATVHAHDLQNAVVHHPFVERTVPILLEETVGLNEGTACVHVAPGCGPIDYEIGVKNKLEIFSPITPDGRYAPGIKPIELENMSVADGQGWVIKKLLENNRLLHKTNVTHSYPHCWRCHNGLIFRATRQWFLDLNKNDLKQRALEAIGCIQFIPDRSRQFLYATIESRWEWCLSRQRSWGVPIPALICQKCDYAYTSFLFIQAIADKIQQEGIEYWDRVDIQEVQSAALVCPGCGIASFRKETDILDVWFDSGISHFAVLQKDSSLAYPADLYLEGIDQHRGWFQSSLLTSMALEETPCMKAIMSHGFTVDAKGQKMSKSLGNVVSPQEIVDRLGTDGLRLWVASIGGDRDAVVSEVVLNNVAEVYRKVRNTCRFLLSNLFDFDYEQDVLAVDQLLMIDRYALSYLQELQRELINAYQAGDFTVVFHKLADYCASELSAFYLDIIKDRLYVEQADGRLRRSAQTTCWHILDALTRLMAPIMSFTAELVSDQYQKDKQYSIHLQQFASQLHLPTDETVATWDVLRDIRAAVLKAIENLREQGIVKHSLEARVELFIDLQQKRFAPLREFKAALEKTPQDFAAFFKEFFIVSEVSLQEQNSGLQKTALAGLYVRVEHARGTKCPRCWQWEETDHIDGLCHRCVAIIK